MSQEIPIDLVYKYIDLTDPNLHRENKIQKDFDNEELRYSLRSALKNLPWIRYIFIIMPNEHVRFLKEENEISSKIRYIKDSDLLGFDSSSSTTFEFNLWQLKKFGCSEHIIYANDDCFFGRPLEKDDFFYESEGNAFPYIFYNEKVGLNMRKSISAKYKIANTLLKKSDMNSMYGYYYMVITAYHIICKALQKKKLSFPKKVMHTLHNAIPLRLSEIELCCDIVKKYHDHPELCLESRKKTILQPSFQSLYSFYFVNSENRKFNKNITYTIRSLQRCDNTILNHDLFCINTGADGGSIDARNHAKKVMESLFPTPTEYER